jgi:hypothetical protein
MPWHGPYRKGAARDRRVVKRAAAEKLNADAKRKDRRQYRLERERQANP